MSTLIIPCVGRKIINKIPQYLNRHPNGKLLIEHSIEGVFTQDYKKVLIVLLSSDAIEYRAKDIILNELDKYPIEIITLEKMTSGPAETVYQAIQKANISGSVVIKDADNYLKTQSVPSGNFVAGLDLNEWDRDIHSLKSKSFLIVNEQGNLLDIIEKQIRSDVVCLGLYGFKKAQDFVKAYNHLNEAKYPISKLYVSHVISYLIGYYGRVFRYVASLEYENWGDDRLWKDMQRDYALYFVNLDNIILGNNISTGDKENLLTLQNTGASFIGYTVKDDKFKALVLEILQNAELKFIDIVYGCPYSEKKEIISTVEELKKKVIDL